MRTIAAADYNRLLAPKLYRQGAQPLLTYAQLRAEMYGCAEVDVVDVILDVLRRASSTEYGARQMALESVIGRACGVGKPTRHVTRWSNFDRLVDDAIRQRKKTA